MIFQHRGVALFFRIVSILTTGYALVDGCITRLKKIDTRQFIFFTIQSNFWCLFFFIYLAVKTILDIRKYGTKGITTVSTMIRGSVNLSILATGLIYHFVLYPVMVKIDREALGFDLYSASNLILHYFTPTATFLDYFLFSNKFQYRWFDPFTWFVLPYIYIIIALTLAEFIPVIPRTRSRYPYFFLDSDKIGTRGVIIAISALSVVFLILAYLIVLFDQFHIKDGHFCFGSHSFGKEKAD